MENMIELKQGFYSPWYAEIRPINGGAAGYDILIKCDANADLYPETYRIFDTEELPHAEPWHCETLVGAKKKARQELNAWKKKEKIAINEHLKPKPQDVIRIY